MPCSNNPSDFLKVILKSLPLTIMELLSSVRAGAGPWGPGKTSSEGEREILQAAELLLFDWEQEL